MSANNSNSLFPNAHELETTKNFFGSAKANNEVLYCTIVCVCAFRTEDIYICRYFIVCVFSCHRYWWLISQPVG